MGNISFSGLSSGLDTDSIVDAMLVNYQSKIDASKKKQTNYEYKQEAWTAMNKKLNDFFSVVDKMRTAGNYTGTKGTASSSAVTINASGTSTKGTHSVTVDKLATSANVHGKIDQSGVSELTKNTKLTDLGMTVGSKLSLSDKEITIEESDTLSTLESKLKALDSKVAVNIDADNGYIFISSQETGSKGEIKLGGDLTALTKLGLDGSVGTTTGQDAEYTYNGVALKSHSNNVSINGISMTLNAKTDSPVKVEISSDPEPIVKMVEEFVESYNTLIKEMDEKYDAVKTGLEPLTDKQREDMTSTEIEKYEDKLKAAILRRDPTLKTVRDELRDSLQAVLSGNQDFKDLASIGVTTGTWTEKGKLTLDKEKLTAALEKNATEVVSLFTKSSVKDTNGKVTTKGGAMTNMYDTFTRLRKRIDSVKSYESYYNDYVVKDNIKSAKTAVTTAKAKYEKMKKMYRAKFTAMEKALSTLNSQGSNISSMLSA